MTLEIRKIMAEKIAVLKEINGRVFYGRDGLYTLISKPQREIQRRLKEQAYLFASFASRLNKNTDEQQNSPEKRQDNSQIQRKFFKKITGESYCQNGLAKVGYNFSNKFPARFIEEYHNFWKKYITRLMTCQADSWSQMANHKILGVSWLNTILSVFARWTNNLKTSGLPALPAGRLRPAPPENGGAVLAKTEGACHCGP